MRIWSAVLALAAVSASAQWNVSASNQLRYSLSSETSREIMEDYFSVEATHGFFLARLRYEVFQPSEEGQDREGQVFRAVGAAAQWGEMTVGHFYALAGRGMAFHGYEHRDLRVDTSLDGLRLTGSRGPLSLLAFSGRTSGGSTVFHLADAQVDVGRGLRFGGTYLARRPVPGRALRPDLELGALRVEANLSAPAPFVDGLDLYLEGGRRSGRGEGVFASVGLTVAGVALGYEHKDYKAMRVSAEGKDFNTPPPATMEHSWTLLARHAHETNADGERGGLGKLEWQPRADVGLTASYGLTEDRTGHEVFEEGYLEARIAEVSRTPLTLALARTVQSLGMVPGEPPLEDQRTHLTVVGELGFPLPWNLTGRCSWTHQHTEGEAVGEFDLERGEVEVAARRWSLALVGEFSNVSSVQRQLPWLPEFRDETRWLSLNASVEVAQRHQVRVMVGSRPQGKVCAGGACRTVPAFRGVEVQAVSMF